MTHARTTFLLAVVVWLGSGCGRTGPPAVAESSRVAEQVWCADRHGHLDVIRWDGHDGELAALDVRVLPLEDGPVTDRDLRNVCSRTLRPWQRTTLCLAEAEGAGIERQPGTDAGAAIVEGTRAGVPVVLRGRVDCGEVTLLAADEATSATPLGPEPRLRDWDDTATLNGWRAVEARWRQAADEGCLDLDAAHALAVDDGRPTIAPTVLLARDPEDPVHAGLCLDVRLQPSGVVAIDYHHIQSPSGATGHADADVSRPDSPDASSGG